MAEQFLDGADVIAVFQQVRGETVAEGVAGDVLVNVGLLRGASDGFLHHAFVKVMAADQAGAWVFGMARGGEDVLPVPFAGGVWIFSGEGMREIDVAEAVAEVGVIERAHGVKMGLQRRGEGAREHGAAVFRAFAVADGDFIAGEIEVFDAQPQAFEDAEAAAVKNLGDQTIDAVQFGDDAAGFVWREDGGEALRFFGAHGVYASV